MRHRALCLSILVLVAAAASAAPPAARAALSPAETQAQDFVQQTIDNVLTVLRDPKLSLDQKKDQVQSIAYARFDFLLVSRLVLAQNWSKLTSQQQGDFVDAFKKHLAATYRNTLDTFRDEKIDVTGTRLEPKGDVTVTTVVKSATGETKVDYRLRQTPEGWRGIDVIIEGVSLVQNFRAQAQEIMSNQGADALIQKLRDKQIDLDAGVKKS